MTSLAIDYNNICLVYCHYYYCPTIHN